TQPAAKADQFRLEKMAYRYQSGPPVSGRRRSARAGCGVAARVPFVSLLQFYTSRKSPLLPMPRYVGILQRKSLIKFASRNSLEGNGRRGPACQDDVGLQADQLLRRRAYLIDVSAGPTKVHSHAAALGPAQARKRLRERRELSLRHGLVFVE